MNNYKYYYNQHSSETKRRICQHSQMRRRWIQDYCVFINALELVVQSTSCAHSSTYQMNITRIQSDKSLHAFALQQACVVFYLLLITTLQDLHLLLYFSFLSLSLFTDYLSLPFSLCPFPDYLSLPLSPCPLPRVSFSFSLPRLLSRVPH